MKVSAIITVYNGEKFIAQAIESVLAQSYLVHEVIVVDDGSVDGTASIIKSYDNVIYLFQANQGQSSALNHGIKKSTGDYIAFLDHDDLWTKNRLVYQLKFFTKDPHLEAVFGLHKRVYNISSNQHTSAEITDAQTARPFPCLGTLLIKKQAILCVGLFDETVFMGNFIEWFARARDTQLKVIHMDKVVLLRRIHEHNNTRIFDHKDYVKVLKSTLDRRRRSSTTKPD